MIREGEMPVNLVRTPGLDVVKEFWAHRRTTGTSAAN